MFLNAVASHLYLRLSSSNFHVVFDSCSFLPMWWVNCPCLLGSLGSHVATCWQLITLRDTNLKGPSRNAAKQSLQALKGTVGSR